jgi:hypothetical protein
MHTQGEMTHTNVELDDIYDLNKILGDSNWEGNMNRIYALWNAANGMTTEEAVRYIEHGREMVQLMEAIAGFMNAGNIISDTPDRDKSHTVNSTCRALHNLLAKLEGK